MRKASDIAGLKPRLEAAYHLKDVLEGKPFNPLPAARFTDPRDRALANRLVTLALRRHGHISAILDAVLAKGVPSRSGLVEAVLRIGIAQLIFAPEMADHSALSLAVEAVRRDRRAGRFDKLVNGALRSVQREKERWEVLETATLFPQWLAERWRGHYGDGALEAFGTALVAGAPLDLTFKAPDPALVETLGASPILGPSHRLASRDAAVADLPGFAQGAWWVQDFAATLPARVLAPAPGEKILDLCAAPGGKTAQLAAAGAEVTALDISAERMERVKDNLARLGLDAELVVADALAYAPGQTFDAVLLDAPCSATGTFRRHPEVLIQRDARGIADRVAIQRALIAKAAGLLRPGGRLVYAVCSLEAEEGEAQLDWTLANVAGLKPLPVGAEALESWAAPVLASGALRTHPGMDLPGGVEGGLDGFFIARFQKQ